MDKVSRAVWRISGRSNKDCYVVLRCAVAVAVDYLPEHPPMKAIQLDVLRRLDRPVSLPSIARALARAAEDVWQYGSRQELEAVFGRPLVEQPSAKSLVFALAEYIRGDAEPAVFYSLWPNPVSSKYGILGRSAGNTVVVSPVDGSLDGLISRVEALNRDQVPLELFLERFLAEPPKGG